MRVLNLIRKLAGRLQNMFPPAAWVITLVVASILTSPAASGERENDSGIIPGLFGSRSYLRSISTTPDWMYESDHAGWLLGARVAGAGDLNGDGFGDIAISVYNYSNGENNEGASFVFYGSPTGLSSTPDWTAEGNQVEAHFARYQQSAGDINGDGYDDLVIGADYYDNGQSNEGVVFLYYGSPSGLSTSPDWTGEIDMAGARLGCSVSADGDVNGDGYDDILAGATSYTNPECHEGAIFLFYGSATGPSSTYDWHDESNRDDNCRTGLGHITAYEDVNGDGYDDIAAGLWGYSNPEYKEGAVWVYHGSPSGPSATPDWTVESNTSYSYFHLVSGAGDVNGDGYGDIVIGGWMETDGYRGRVYCYLGSPAGLSSSHAWMKRGDQPDARMFNPNYAGDINDDGYSDVIIAASRYDNPEHDEGKTYIYFGSSSGLSETPAWTAEGNQADAMFGAGIASAGDINGDGYPDILIGAHRYDGGQTDEGAAYLFYGGPADTIYIDDDYCNGCGNDGHVWGYDAFDNIQDGVNAVAVGGDVIVAEGTYQEQVEISKDLTLTGVGSSTVIISPDTLDLYFTTSDDNYPILYVHDVDDVTIEDLAVDGAGKGNVNSDFVGVGYHNAGGTVYNCLIKDVRETPFSGAQHGVALYCYNDDGTSRTINVTGNQFNGFQKNAMALNADDTTPLAVNVNDNTITGAGTTTVTAQNGVQVWAAQGTGTVENNTITGIGYSGSGWVASSILAYYASLDITGNTISAGQAGVYDYAASSMSVSGNEFTIENIGDGSYGVIIYDPIETPPSPYNPVDGSGGGGMLYSPAGTHSLDINGNKVTFSGTDNTGCYGIIAWAGLLPDDLAITADHNEVSGFEIGIGFVSADTSTAIFDSAGSRYNLLSGNTYGMYSDGDYMTVEAEMNWWGDASGPAHPALNPGAAGDSVTDYVDFDPWMESFNHVRVLPEYVITNCTDHVTVDFYFGQAGLGQEVRGYNLTFTVDNAVATVGSAGSDITEGTFLSDAGTTSFYALDNGGGSYTVSCAILGGDTGATGEGELFGVELTPVAEGISDIAITEFELRDLNNSPIDNSTSDGSVRIDCTVPTMEPIAEAENGWYNTAPDFSNFGFDDDINLDTAQYQVDSDGWVTLFDDIDATEWNDDGWTLPGFAGLTEGSHTVYFRVADDAGNWNGENTPDTYSWQFNKDTVAPDPPTDFAAEPGHNKVHLTWTNPTGDATFAGVELRRAGWTDYPEYSTAAPDYPADETEGTFIAQTPAQAYDDSVTAGRDIYYFSAFSYDLAGNYSAFDADAADRATSYWLGDVVSPYDGMVNSTDLVDFSNTFGVSDGGAGWNNECDFGPTDDNSSYGIPLPDDVVDFEDLMIFAMIYGKVGPLGATMLAGGERSLEQLNTLVDFELTDANSSSAPEGCVVVSVQLKNRANSLKGFRISLQADRNRVTSVTRGSIFDGSSNLFFGTTEGENSSLDICVAALGVGVPIDASGEVARITLETSGEESALRICEIDVRDINNKAYRIEGDEDYRPGFIPSSYALKQNYPNPFNPVTTIAFDIVEAGRVRIDIYDVSGRMVRTLLNESRDPGRHRIEWNGRDNSGSTVPSGIYFYRINAGEFTATRKMILLR